MSTTPAATNSQNLKTALAVVLSVTETIREAGEVPGGTIYAALMTKGVDFQTYEKIIGTIVNTGLVVKRGDLLVWNGPHIR